VLGDLGAVLFPDEASGEVADPREAVPRGCRRDRRGPTVLDGLELGGILDAKADVDAVHSLHRAVHGRAVGN
jgi:hypothetical protein